MDENMTTNTNTPNQEPPATESESVETPGTEIPTEHAPMAEPPADESFLTPPPVPQQTYGSQTIYNNDNSIYDDQLQVQPKGLAIAGMVCGIVGLVIACCSPLFGGVIAVVGLVLAIVALKKKQSKGMAVTGIITGALGIILAVVVSIFAAFIGMALTDAMENPEFRQKMEETLDLEELSPEQQDAFEELEDMLE